MKRFIAFVFLTFAMQSIGYLLIQAQDNLVPNAGFELHNLCPNGDSGLQSVEEWFSPNANLADYFNECATNFFYAVPENEFGEQTANGKAYVGIHTYFLNSALSDRREYISIALKETMVSGQVYCISFKVNLADESQVSIGEIGLYLSIQNPNSIDLFGVNPQVVNLSPSDLSIKEDWVSISIDYTALGGEQYLTIGNFNDDASTLSEYIHPQGLTGSAYYFIDDVMIFESIVQNINLDLGKDDTVCEDSRILFLEEVFSKYEWQDCSTADQYIAEETGWYSVIVEDACGNQNQDSVYLAFKNCEESCLKFPNTFTPNGDGRNDTFKGRLCEINDLNFKIFNRWGELIFMTQNPQEGWNGTYQNEAQPIGTYLWSVEYIDPNGLKQTNRGFINLLR